MFLILVKLCHLDNFRSIQGERCGNELRRIIFELVKLQLKQSDAYLLFLMFFLFFHLWFFSKIRSFTSSFMPPKTFPWFTLNLKWIPFVKDST